MRGFLAGFTLALLLMLLHLGAATPTEAQLFTPGPLAEVHRELEGDANCTKCHSQGRRVDEQRCTECHDDIGSQRKRRQGLHGRNFAADACGDCHVDHRGLRHDLVRWPGGSIETFEHGLTGFGLRGAHSETQCADCHDRKNRRGASTFLGLSQACGSCHEDPHERRFGDDCLQCHNESDFKQTDLDRFEHGRARFPLNGEHARVECVECHGEPPQYRDLAFQSCKDCHDDPHQGRLTSPCATCHDEQSFTHIIMPRAEHPGLSLAAGHRPVECATCHDVGADVPPSRGAACVACHEPVHEANFGTQCERCHESIQFLNLPDKLGRAVHDRTPFALKGQHVQVACGACHRPQMPRPQRYRGLDFERCADCHQDEHAGEFTARDGGECKPCHSERGFAPTRFGLVMHERTAFPLEGRHRAVACSGCHDSPRPRLTWRVPAQRCEDCHQNPHGDQFVDEMRQDGCAHCHSPAGFEQPRIDHSTWPLSGAHATAACDACHTPTEEDRRSGQGASYRGVPRECAGCHEDEHAGQFRLTEPQRPCADCHNTERFEGIEFKHAEQANYPLEGAHAQLQCGSCHPTVQLLPPSEGQQVIRYRLGYRRCRDCHADPHGGALP